MSHPYIHKGELGDQLSVVPHRRLRSPDVDQASPLSQEKHAHSVRCMSLNNIFEVGAEYI